MELGFGSRYKVMKLQTILIFIGVIIILTILSNMKNNDAHIQVEQTCTDKNGVLLEQHPDGIACINRNSVISVEKLQQQPDAAK